MPRFIPFAEPALSISSVKEPFVRRKTFSEIEGQWAYSRRKDYFDHFSVAQVIAVRVFFTFNYIVLFSSAL